MIKPGTLAGIDVRPWESSDEQPVLDLLATTLTRSPAGKRTAQLFRWKHLDNPFGPSFMLVAESGGRIVGFRSFMAWRLETDDGIIAAARPVDTATHPDFRRRGIFSRLTMEALAALGSKLDLVFNTPNKRSLPGYLKLGWEITGTIPVSVRPVRPLRFAAAVRTLRESPDPRYVPPAIDAPAAADVLCDEDAIRGLIAQIEPQPGRLRTARDVEYLRWRYGGASGLDYRAVAEREGGKLAGIAFFRVRPRGRLCEATVTDVLVRSGGGPVARRLLRSILRASSPDHLTCSFGSQQGSGGARNGFVRVPFGPKLAVKQLRGDMATDPAALRSWALSLGDVELL